ncbi:MAG TPA: hypothetical protein VM146_18810 [Steroidobacteraceae bacterium]|nr:hypothetical protein [Steroidobacteraceae bacterium]
MKLSELSKVFAGNESQYGEFSVLLVDLDLAPSEGIDVVISPLRDLEVDAEAGEIRLYSAAVRQDSRNPPLALFEYFRSAWPMAGVHDVDFDVKVHMPIATEGYPHPPVSLLPLAGVWIGRESEEIWLLVQPQSEYPVDLLPA